MTQNTLLVFPCDFPVKIIGRSSASFLTDISNIIRKHYPNIQDNAIAHQYSQQGTYLSITVMIHALDQETLNALYSDLTQHPDIQMVL
jgi:putative lipoic acid-binding regulatory protein